VHRNLESLELASLQVICLQRRHHLLLKNEALIEPTITDWISAIAAVVGVLVAVVGGWIALRTFAHQRTANDVELALSIFAEINRYWDRISENSNNYQYDIGQVLTYFEIACALFNRDVLTKEATIILGDHIVEVFTQMQGDKHSKEFLEKCRSSEATFSELKKFAKQRLPQALNALAFSERTRM
tara:strand:+ start:496 stop:1050 length:555 start_codon:yes stop_codon:yes gene_type:complete